MNDFSQVIEYSVMKERGRYFPFLRILLPIISFIASVVIGILLFGLYGPVIGAVMTLILLAVSLVFCSKRLRVVHYDYRMVQNELYFAMIINRKKRKELGSVNVSHLDTVAPYSEGYREEANRISYDKVYDFSSSVDSPNTYYAVDTDDDSSLKTIFFFTPSDKMLRAMKTYNRRTVITRSQNE